MNYLGSGPCHESSYITLPALSRHVAAFHGRKTERGSFHIDHDDEMIAKLKELKLDNRREGNQVGVFFVAKLSLCSPSRTYRPASFFFSRSEKRKEKFMERILAVKREHLRTALGQLKTKIGISPSPPPRISLANKLSGFPANGFEINFPPPPASTFV